MNTEKQRSTDSMESGKKVFISSQRQKPKQIVQYLPMDSGEWKIAEITSKGGKSNGKYQDWLNIKNRGDNGESSTGWEAGVNEWHVIGSEEDLDNLIGNLKDLSINENGEEFLFSEDICSNKESLKIAKFAELKNWNRNKAYEEVPHTG